MMPTSSKLKSPEEFFTDPKPSTMIEEARAVEEAECVPANTEGFIGLFDMDNTLFDYDGQLLADMNELKSPDEVLPRNLHNSDQPWLKARVDLIKTRPGWWRNLPVLEMGWDIWKLSTMMGFENHILTKGPKTKPWAWAEKVECIHRHFGLSVNIDIVGKDKSNRYGRFLCDDYPPYLTGWLKHRPRGLAIMPAHWYNEDFKHPNVIRYRGIEDMETISKALAAVKRRVSGQHWKELL